MQVGIHLYRECRGYIILRVPPLTVVRTLFNQKGFISMKENLDELRQLNRLSIELNEAFGELNEKLNATSAMLRTIQDAYDSLPHASDLEPLADVSNRICFALAEARENVDSFCDDNDGDCLGSLVDRFDS